ncbi:MAG: PEP-CTERM sorting domain-containing protein [Akkermansiaceae bacterium]
MKNTNYNMCGLLALAMSLSSTHAASVSFWLLNNAAGNEILSATGAELSAGNPNTQNGNGDVFQLGYFDNGTLTGSSTFNGTWTALAGVGSNNPSLGLRIGDFDAQDGSTPVPNGFYSATITFDTANGTDVGLPSADTQLAIRYYDGSNPITANYNTVTHSSWRFVSPASPAPATIQFDLNSDPSGLVWQDSSQPFRTTIAAVPEPSHISCLGISLVAFILRRRK